MNGSSKAIQKRSMASGGERRASKRLPPAAFPHPVSVSLNSLPDLALVNISRGGALLQTSELLRPNTKIALKIAVDGAIHTVTGRVLRSNIVSLEGGLQYHSAVAFDQEFSALGEPAAAPEVKTTPGALGEPAAAPEVKTTPGALGEPAAAPEVKTTPGALGEPAAAPEVKTTPGASCEAPPPPDVTPTPKDDSQLPPEDDFIYIPEEVMVPTPESRISNPALLQALKLNRW
jgi:hypothetical protein